MYPIHVFPDTKGRGNILMWWRLTKSFEQMRVPRKRVFFPNFIHYPRIKTSSNKKEMSSGYVEIAREHFGEYYE